VGPRDVRESGLAKLDEVHAYFERFFPGEVKRHVAQGEEGYAFHVLDERGGIRHEVHVSEAFLARHHADDIQRVLSDFQLFDALRQAGRGLVHVEPDGLHVTPAPRP
jgi:hypothetical protein